MTRLELIQSRLASYRADLNPSVVEDMVYMIQQVQLNELLGMAVKQQVDVNHKLVKKNQKLVAALEWYRDSRYGLIIDVETFGAAEACKLDAAVARQALKEVGE